MTQESADRDLARFARTSRIYEALQRVFGRNLDRAQLPADPDGWYRQEFESGRGMPKASRKSAIDLAKQRRKRAARA